LVLEGEFADTDSWIPQRCPVAKALDVVGARSTLLLLREAHFGTRRFDAFVRRVQISEAVAAAQLRRLVAAGLLRKEPYQEPGQRTRYEYHLTRMGLDLMPAIIAFMQWGDTYLQGDLGAAVDLRHLDCGETVAAEVRCAAGHAVGPDDIVMRPASPPGSAARAEPLAGRGGQADGPADPAPVEPGDTATGAARHQPRSAVTNH
jgi:DNA-binding HxlR family transcriptional regulator